MRIRYSLRTLIIACVVAGLVVWLGVEFYLTEVNSPELSERRHKIEAEINGLKAIKRSQYFQRSIENFWSDNGGAGNSTNDWDIHVVSSVGDNERRIKVFGLRAACSRKRLAIQPIEFEYDEAVDNEELIQKLKVLCDEKHWRYVIRKVKKLEE